MKKRISVIVILTLFSLGFMAIWQYVRFNDGKLHIIFCNVGQGDAILIKTPNNKYILVDGGPDRAVVNCLAKHMPFWDRTIDLLLLTHPHADHFFGMFYTLERYDVQAFATEDLVNKTRAFDELISGLTSRNVHQQFVSAGDVWEVGGVLLRVVGPSMEYLERTSPGGTIGESKEFASLLLHVQYGEFDLLLTGDSQVAGLEDANDAIEGDIDVLHIPHHGSQSGLDEPILLALAPALAVVSVGAENRYNHPHPYILELLQSQQIKLLRTDHDGDVVIESDGHGWKVAK